MTGRWPPGVMPAKRCSSLRPGARVHPQAEGFTSHEVWNFAGTSADQYPLLLHFPTSTSIAQQVVKQADLVLAMHLRGDAFHRRGEESELHVLRDLTVRDSSLSASTQAVIAAEVGHLGLARDYLAETALMDLDDFEHNTRDGLHLAALAGTWIALVSGFAGLRERAGTVASLPACRGNDPAGNLALATPAPPAH